MKRAACYIAIIIALFACTLALFAGCAQPVGAVAHITDVPATPTPTPTPAFTPVFTPVFTYDPTPVPTPVPTPEPTAEPTAEPVAQRVTLGFIGDILMMTSQISGAKTENGYDFSRSFEALEGLFSSMDIMYGNFEGTLAGEAAGYTLPRESMAPVTEANPTPTKAPFQRFNAPDELARDLAEAGFDLLSTVNNHSMDKGIDGLYRTVSVIRDAGIAQLGTYLDEADADVPCILEVGGMKLGFVAMTDIMNRGVPSLTDEQARYALIRLGNKDAVEAAIDRCRDAGAEFIIAFVHWGKEHSDSANSTQKKQADELIALGVDAIIGSHPHVVEDIEWREAVNELGDTVRVPVAYSLGNFISNMSPPKCNYGLFVKLTLERDDTGGVRCTRLAYLPLLCYRDGVHRVKPCFESDTGSALNAFRHVTQVCGGDNIYLIDRREAESHAREARIDKTTR